MDIHTVRAFFMWCTIINIVLLAFTFLMCAFAGDWIQKMHGKWFPMPKETFTVLLYSYIAVFKIFVIVFNIVPWIALMIMN